MKTAFLFPGQGAQHAGMGQDIRESLPAARAIFDRAEAVTGLPLKQLCSQGPEARLARTDIAQPAIFTVSVAMLESFKALLGDRQQSIAPDYAAGLSLGEYTALYSAGAMDFETGVRLVARRGQLMQQAAEAAPSGMVSIIGLDEAGANELCQAAGQGDILACANFNCPGQIVLSGQLDACRRAEAMAKDFGASAAVPLKVAGAFHSRLMAPAAEQLAEAMAPIAFKAPSTGILANVDASPYADADEIKPKLLAQLTSPVRWQQSMEALLERGVERFYEIGPGRVLKGLMRRIHRRADIVSINSLKAIEEMASQAD